MSQDGRQPRSGKPERTSEEKMILGLKIFMGITLGSFLFALVFMLVSVAQG
jgi:hypothetical protein